MASIADLCWTSTEDLFEDVDLDELFLRQLRTIGAEHWDNYPYLILVHTGKIAIGINLGREFDAPDWLTALGPNQLVDAVPFALSRPPKDHTE
jgi:hypothetical protein